MTHAENDEDKRAIACLERAVDHDPHSLPTLLALGVSYVNELDSVRALQNLKAWIEHNPKYQVRPFLHPHSLHLIALLPSSLFRTTCSRWCIDVRLPGAFFPLLLS